jgi:prevent-host-death family protein
MEEIAISKFKATCLALLERVRKTREPIRITRFGKPVAEVVPPSTPPAAKGWIGALKDTGRIRGDIVGPVAGERDWEILNK